MLATKDFLSRTFRPEGVLFNESRKLFIMNIPVDGVPAHWMLLTEIESGGLSFQFCFI
jgi:hypothetical protein